MGQGQNKNLIRLVLWSIIPIAVGITFSGFVVKAFTTEESSEENDEGETNIPDIIVAYLQKIKGIAGQSTNRAAAEPTDIDFKEILYPPEATYQLKDKDFLPKVGAAAYVVADVDTGEIIIEKNAEEVYPIASVTKLMTALVSLEDLNQSDIAKVSNKALGTLGGSGDLRQNEKMKISDLLYPLLLVSSNDASEVLAEHKGRDKFMQLMNDTAKKINMEETNYEDPSGLSPNNYSTAKDLFALTHYLYNNHRTVFNITTLDKYSLGGRTWSNANFRFSKRDDYLGGKTGYTARAKRTGVSIFRTKFEDYDDRNVAIILLRTDNRTEDINNILDYLHGNVYFAYDEEIRGSENAEVRLGFVGDIMLDRGVKTSVYKNFGGNYEKVFEEAGKLKTPDIMFGNLEGPISDQGKNVGSKFSFRFEPGTASVLKSAGFDIVSFANNHVGDWSQAAFLDTLGHLAENNILFTGAGDNYEKVTKPTIIERSGIQIGFLGMSDVGPEWMAASDANAGILLANDKNLGTIIEEAKKDVDVLFVSVHWGDEYKEHNQRQETLAKKIIDAGADVVIGHHPHVVQDVEEYKEGLIIYSLGNFVFDQYFSPETMQGMYASVVVGRGGVKYHEETIFDINEKYQPVLDAEVIETADFETGSCPIGNSENDYLMFNSNNDNSVGDYIPEGLVEINGVIATKEGRTICLIEEAASALARMQDDAKKAGLEIVASSGFRSYQTQTTLHNNSSSSTDDDTENDSVAKPGHSEHQLGTTLDMTTPEINMQSTSTIFEKTELFKWLNEHADEYGFSMSYPKGGGTGYIYEPWHWRYLGPIEAKEIKEKGVTIQEYLREF